METTTKNCCSSHGCDLEAAPYSDLCDHHLAGNVFARIERRNHALAAMLDSTLPNAVRNAAMDVAFAKAVR